jgi:hypothetical protein
VHGAATIETPHVGPARAEESNDRVGRVSRYERRIQLYGGGARRATHRAQQRIARAFAATSVWSYCGHEDAIGWNMQELERLGEDWLTAGPLDGSRSRERAIG